MSCTLSSTWGQCGANIPTLFPCSLHTSGCLLVPRGWCCMHEWADYMRAAQWGHYMRWELWNLRPVDVGPDVFKINHFMDTSRTGSMPSAFVFWKYLATFKINPFIRAWAVTINTFVPYITCNVTNSGKWVCKYIQLSEIIKMNYIMNLHPPDSNFSDLGKTMPPWRGNGNV